MANTFITYSKNSYTDEGYTRKPAYPIMTNVGNNIVQADITLNHDGVSYCELRDACRLEEWDQDAAGSIVTVNCGDLNFTGECLKVGLEWDPAREYVLYRLANTSSWLNRAIVAGRKVKAHIGTMYLYGQNTTFNPGGRPNMDSDTNWTDPCFVAPEMESIEDNDALPHKAVHWNIMDMLGYCFANSLGGGGNLAIVFSGGTTVINNLKPSDVSVSGNLLSCLSTILAYCNNGYIIDPETDEISFVSTVYPGNGRNIKIPRDRVLAKTITGSSANKGNIEADYGYNSISRVYGAGGNKRYESTILLKPGWNPDLETEAKSFFKSQDLGAVDICRMMNIYENDQFETYKNVGRKFVANDAGYWQLVFPNYTHGAYDWSAILGSGKWYEHRRPFMDRRLKKDPVTGEGLPPILEYRYTPAPVNCPGFPNTWKVFNGKWEFLKDEAGIYVHDPQPLWTPGYGFPEFRITTGIEGDEALQPYIASAEITSKYDKVTWSTGLGQFIYEKITLSEHDSDEVLRNDSNRLSDYLQSMEDRVNVNPLVSGSVTIPWHDPGWMPGDWVGELEGTGFVVEAMVLSVRYECGKDGYYTTLNLGHLGSNG